MSIRKSLIIAVVICSIYLGYGLGAYACYLEYTNAPCSEIDYNGFAQCYCYAQCNIDEICEGNWFGLEVHAFGGPFCGQTMSNRATINMDPGGDGLNGSAANYVDEFYLCGITNYNSCYGDYWEMEDYCPFC